MVVLGPVAQLTSSAEVLAPLLLDPAQPLPMQLLGLELLALHVMALVSLGMGQAVAELKMPPQAQPALVVQEVRAVYRAEVGAEAGPLVARLPQLELAGQAGAVRSLSRSITRSDMERVLVLVEVATDIVRNVIVVGDAEYTPPAELRAIEAPGAQIGWLWNDGAQIPPEEALE